MRRKRLYSIVKLYSEGQKVSVEPTEYLQKLPPREAAKELRAHIQWLMTELKQSSNVDLETPEHFEKITQLLYELQVTQKYVTCFEETYVARVSRCGLK